MSHAARCIASLLVAATVVATGCRREGRVPTWIHGAPKDTLFALSGNLGWMLKQPIFQTALVKYPMADRILDTFIRQANIDLRSDTGRVGLFVMGDPKALEGAADPKLLGSSFVLSLSEFKDDVSLLKAMAEAFPPEGSLRVGQRDYPLHVVMDFNQWHIRAMRDARGTIWLGDLQALNRLTGEMGLPKGIELAASWIEPNAQLQGVVNVDPILSAARRHQSAQASDFDFMGALPQGIEAAAFSASVIPQKPDAMTFQLVVSGTESGIQQTQPWMQRLLAVAASLQGGGGLPGPELFQEKDRMGLRCPLTEEQVKKVVERLIQMEKQGIQKP